MFFLTQFLTSLLWVGASCFSQMKPVNPIIFAIGYCGGEAWSAHCINDFPVGLSLYVPYLRNVNYTSASYMHTTSSRCICRSRRCCSWVCYVCHRPQQWRKSICHPGVGLNCTILFSVCSYRIQGSAGVLEELQVLSLVELVRPRSLIYYDILGANSSCQSKDPLSNGRTSLATYNCSLPTLIYFLVLLLRRSRFQVGIYCINFKSSPDQGI